MSNRIKNLLPQQCDFEDVVEELVDFSHSNSERAMQWVRAQLGKLPKESVEAMRAILWAGGRAVGEGGYCERHGKLAWRHNQHVALDILCRKAGVEQADQIPPGLNVSSPRWPDCSHQWNQLN